jgi:hypothetical protein
MGIIGAIVGGLVGTVIGCVFRGLIFAWPVMLMIGGIHSAIPAIPALGFGTVVLIVATLALLIPTDSSSSSD